MNFKIKNGRITFDKMLSRKQLQRLQIIDRLHNNPTKGKLVYLQTILGDKVRIFNIKTLLNLQPDMLKLKKTELIISHQRSLMDNSEGMQHIPLIRSVDSGWIGVEIECNIDGCAIEGSENCESCEGSGEFYDDGDYTTCTNCGGQGTFDNEPREKLKDAITAAGIKRVSVRGDGSLDSENGVELCILFNSKRSFKPLHDLCKVLNDFGATITQSCGLHVHLDCPEYNNGNIIDLGHKFKRYEDLLFGLQPETRRDNNYCKKGLDTDDRYRGINVGAFFKFNTIEIRLHTGSTNAEKIENWITLLTAIKNHDVAGQNAFEPKTIEGMSKELNLSEYLTDYLQNRWNGFNGVENTEVANTEVTTTEITTRTVGPSGAIRPAYRAPQAEWNRFYAERLAANAERLAANTGR